MATYAQFKHVELYKIGHGKNRVPNAPKSCIAEIFNAETTDGPVRNGGGSRPRALRDTPTRPRDTHSRLFGQQLSSQHVAPMVTDTSRSQIQFGDSGINGTPSQSPSKMNGSVSSTPSRASYQPPKRNPVTGDGVPFPTQRRRHPAASLRGADPDDPFPTAVLEPQPSHRYIQTAWPPRPADYYVHSATKPSLSVPQTPYMLLGLSSDDPEKTHPIIDPNNLSQKLILDRHWPPFPAQHYLEKDAIDNKTPYHPLPPYAFIGMSSALGDRPRPDYKYNPFPTLDGPIDPFLAEHVDPPASLFKYERDGPIPDVSPLPTSAAGGPVTLAGFPPIFHRHVPGYLFNRNRHAEDFDPKTYYVDYIRRRQMEGNPITGDYKSMNGQINTVTSIAGSSHRVPPGGFSSGLW